MTLRSSAQHLVYDAADLLAAVVIITRSPAHIAAVHRPEAEACIERIEAALAELKAGLQPVREVA